MKFIRKLGRLFLFLFALSVLGYFYVHGVYLPKQFEVENEISERVNFQIESGESIRSIANKLDSLGVIPSEWAFVQYLKKENLDTKIEAGSFSFVGGETIPELVEILLNSQAQQISLTILEGWNTFEIDKKLAELSLIEPNEFADFIKNGAKEYDLWWLEGNPTENLEGYIFPATYFIDPNNFSVKDLVGRMLQAMDKKLEEAGWHPEKSNFNLHQILIMASIIELEEKSEENRPLVADILWRRLDSGMALGADATLFYTLGHKEVLSYDDLQTDSPYNTRKNIGLPPTPVCSPSLSSIRAALNPEPNDYWYYLHDVKTGEIHFAKTLEGHNENKRKYIY